MPGSNSSTTSNPTILNKRKIAVLGSRSVGKSSLVIQYAENHFVENYHPTIENTFAKTIKAKGEEYDCDIIDTAGQDEFSILNSKYAIGIHGYILVYSVASRKSLEMVKIVHDKITDFIGEDTVPCVIVGAKNDIKQRQVSAQDGERTAKELGCAFVETSARNNLNVGRVFEICVGEIEKRTPKGQTPKESSCCIM